MKNGNGHTDQFQAYLQCGVTEGQFRGEKVVTFKISGRTISAIVSEQFIAQRKAICILKVEVYKQENDKALIGIPGECFAATRRHWVSDKELILEPA